MCEYMRVCVYMRACVCVCVCVCVSAPKDINNFPVVVLYDTYR